MAACLLLGACASSSSRQPSKGTAYVGPLTLNLRADLDPRAETIETVQHGDRLDILDTQRRFVKVRTKSGAEGWTAAEDLLAQSQIDDLQRLGDYAAALPSLGAATVLDTLNVHTGPARDAPFLLKLEDGDPIEVVGHRVMRRDDHRNDDWFLVRTPQGKAGWVLTRSVLMKIPEEVAQYAEGQFIMSYHPLGEVHDTQRGETKEHWLWTTSRLNEPFDFDGFRVFTYNPRSHRYETAYRERNLKGRYPVETQVTDGGTLFTLVADDKDGVAYKRTYLFNGSRVRLQSKEPAPPSPAAPEVRSSDTFDGARPPSDEDTWRGKARRAAEYWFGF